LATAKRESGSFLELWQQGLELFVIGDGCHEGDLQVGTAPMAGSGLSRTDPGNGWKAQESLD
jgi:hypothetical protein